MLKIESAVQTFKEDSSLAQVGRNLIESDIHPCCYKRKNTLFGITKKSNNIPTLTNKDSTSRTYELVNSMPHLYV